MAPEYEEKPSAPVVIATRDSMLSTQVSASDARSSAGSPTSRLLVSVRSTAEAIAACEGGAGLIDVKEPSRGSLGRADDAVVAAVVQAVGGRKPVSAARGELTEFLHSPQRKQTLSGLSYVKWGLAGCGRVADWRALLAAAAVKLPTDCRPVAVAYADWRRAAAPTPKEVCAFASDQRWGALLVDTWHKDGKTLLEFLALCELRPLVECCREAGVPVALAGSLGRRQIEMLLPLAPDWIAVRGAACREGNRNYEVDRERVCDLTTMLARSAGQGFLARGLG
jgi:uncharacterized protein (UPF0264 family)